MEIRRITPEPNSSERLCPLPDGGAAQVRIAPVGVERTPGDRVAISAEARVGACEAFTEAEEILSAERIAGLRAWIAEGAYKAPDILDHVARRLLQLGEV